MKIVLPGIAHQQRFVFEAATKAAIKTLQENLKAPVLPPQTEIDESLYPRTHLLREHEGWEPPHPDIVAAYFRHFQQHFPEYNSDAKLARLLGLSGDRRIRAFKSGAKGEDVNPKNARTVPYGVWRHFLVLTGRAPQDVVKVMAYMG